MKVMVTKIEIYHLANIFTQLNIPYLGNIIIDFQNSDTRKIQLTIEINFIIWKDGEEECVMHSRSNNIKVTSYEYVNEIVDELFVSLCSRYQGKVETSMRRTDFIFDSLQLVHYKLHNVNFKHGGSYTDSPDWIKMKKGTISPKNTDDKCFQHEATIALNCDEIK